MKRNGLKKLPFMLFADDNGAIYDHPYYRMAGFSRNSPIDLVTDELVPMPRFSKLFFIPDCPPIGLDPSTGEYKRVTSSDIEGRIKGCHAVAAFLEPGFVRSHLPAVDYSPKKYVLPSWAYAAVGFSNDQYLAAGFRIEYNHKWDPRNYDDRDLVSSIEKYKGGHMSGPLTSHLIKCATENHCFAAKNLFLGRWEAPVPVSRTCNAQCLGCLSLQPDDSCEASHARIAFRPSKKEIVDLAVRHLDNAPEPIISFGQGCEGEPLTEHTLISETIREIREKTDRGTINLNTNGSMPDKIRQIARSGLDSIRISMNSARPEFYRSYYRPRGYDFEDVETSISLSREMGLYTMINDLVFPGITDQEDEIEALGNLIDKTGVNFLHLKNLCIDPLLYITTMPDTRSPAIGMRNAVSFIKDNFPSIELGYFNKPVKRH
jgi:pyruvate-formate lyase-activating enzyme